MGELSSMLFFIKKTGVRIEFQRIIIYYGRESAKACVENVRNDEEKTVDRGGLADMLVMRLVDIMLVIPTLPLTIVLTNLFGKSYFMIIFIFTLFGWTGLARVVRSQVLVLKNSNYVRAAELAGAGRWHIMFRHILPGVSHLLIMSTALTSAGIMVAEAGLSFLGLGDPTAISWGRMLADAQSGGALLFGHWWWIIAPGIGIFLSVFSFMRIGLAMEEIFNPRMKRSSGLYKLFRTLNNDYIQEVFDSMEEGGPGGPGKGGAYDG